MKRTPLLLLIPALAIAGCELIVDFDRTKIPAETDGAAAVVPVTDGSTEVPDGAVDEDGSTPEDDAGDDAATDDASTDDAGDEDAGGDAGTEDDAGDAGDAG